MQAFLVRYEELVTAKVRQLLLREGQDCPAAHLLSPLALDHLAQANAELIVVVLPPVPETGLAVLDGLRRDTKARLLAIGPAADTKLVLRALRAGADDYVDEQDLESEQLTALQRLASQADAQAEPGRTLAVLAPSGGSGSSTLAVNLATVLAKQHEKAALIDLVLTPLLSHLLGWRAGLGAASLVCLAGAGLWLAINPSDRLEDSTPGSIPA